MDIDVERQFFLLTDEEKNVLGVRFNTWPFKDAGKLLQRLDNIAQSIDISYFPDHARRQETLAKQQRLDNILSAMRAPLLSQVMGEAAENFLRNQLGDI